MLVRHTHRNLEDLEWEILKWIAIIIVAAALCLLFATASAFAGGPAARAEPAALPSGIEEWARPMESEFDWMMPTENAAEHVWNVFELHRTGRHAEALEAWTKIELPANMRIWKFLAMTDAYLGMNRLEEAAEALNIAGGLAEHHPLLHYYTGLLRLEEAATADEWRDAEMGTVRLVTVPRITPNTKSMFKLAAIMEFESAIEHASLVEIDRSLVSTDWPTRAAVEPTVRDLLLALKADRFVGRSHHMLGGLYLEKGSIEVAENHFDAATVEGIAVITGYRDLGRSFEEEGRYLDATRAYLKAARSGGVSNGSLKRAFECFGRAFGDIL